MCIKNRSKCWCVAAAITAVLLLEPAMCRCLGVSSARPLTSIAGAADAVTAAATSEKAQDRRFHEFAEDLRQQTQLRFHRLVLFWALSMFLVFHGALLYFYPWRLANVFFCITLGLSLATLGVLHAQEAAETTLGSQRLYWFFIAMVLVCMVSGLALTQALFRGVVSKRHVAAWSLVFAVLYFVGWVQDVSNWAFVALPLSTAENLRIYIRDGWKKFPGAWMFGVGMACFAIALCVDAADEVVDVQWPPRGVVSYLWVYGFVAFLASVSVYIGREFAAATRKLEELTATLETRVVEYATKLEKEHLAQAHLETLRYQLNPHFLFNALNSIEALSREEPSHVPAVIRWLSECLRYSLDASQDGTATLGEELEAVTAYLRVEKVRFEEQLEVECDIAHDARGQRVPEFFLQPLVENAVKHGMHTSDIPLRIVIVARCDAGRLLLEVRNTGRLAHVAGHEDGRGIGLRNTRDRLQLLYDDEYHLALREEEGWVVAEIGLPLKKD